MQRGRFAGCPSAGLSAPPRTPDARVRLVERLTATVLAWLLASLGGCAQQLPSSPSAPAASSGATSSAAPADESPAPTGARKTVAEFVWPTPLSACAADVPALGRGLIVGSWSVEAPADFDQQHCDEAGLRQVFTNDLAGRRKWRGFRTTGAEIPVDDLLDDRKGPAEGYVYSLLSRVAADVFIADEPAVLHVRHRGRVRMYLDGELVLDAEPAALGWAEHKLRVVLTGPYDVLLVKTARGGPFGASMNLEVRVSAPDGSSLPGQDWKPMRPPGLPSDLPLEERQ